jgi:HK97 family phage portal protein
MPTLKSFLGWFGLGSSRALAETQGVQRGLPGAQLVPEVAQLSADAALQISAVWSCIERRANVIASLPLFVYQVAGDGQKSMARGTRLYELLHSSPNARMTPFDFWRAVMMNYDLRGNAYVRIERDERTGEAVSLWPMPSDQVRVEVQRDSSVLYEYRINADVAILAAENVLHLKNLGNGTIGLSKLEFMRATVDEMAKAQGVASRLYANGGKPTGVLMVDKILTNEQRERIRERFGEMSAGPMSRLYVLEASMKYEVLSLTPEQLKLLETRHFGVEELCRWYDVPPVLVYHSNVTTWGSGIEQIVDGWHKLSIRPVIVGIEQALRKAVMTPAQRVRLQAEFSMDALLRGSLKDRAGIYAQLSQNGGMTRNEIRQLENLPRSTSPMADQLTVQTNLVPIDMLGKIKPTGGTNASSQEPVSQ